MTITTVAGLPYWATTAGTGYTAPGRLTLPTTMDRSSLVSGAFIANRRTSGLLPGWTPSMLTPVPPNSSGQIPIKDPGPYENKIFWGTVLMQSPTMPVFRNCAFPGKDPRTATSATGVIKAYGSGYYQWWAEDCLLDAGLWMDPTVQRPDGAAPIDFKTWNRAVATRVNGLHGGRGTLLRCEVTRVGDTVQSVQTPADASDTSFTRIKHSWLHGNAYYLGADYASLGLPADGNHADGFQFSTGQHFYIEGNLIGGPRDTTGFETYNPATNPDGASFNSGDDAFNAGIMVSQGGTQPPSSLQLLGDIEITKNIFWGGKYCINHPQSSTRPNPFTTFAAHDNLYVRRADGRYVIRNAAFADRYWNERVIDLDGFGGFTVGELITFTNG
jgi:hypothetical protein